MGDSYVSVSIIGDFRLSKYDIMGDSFIAVSIIGDSGFAEYGIMGDSIMAVSNIGDSGFAEYGIMGDSIMAVSIIGDSGSVFCAGEPNVLSNCPIKRWNLALIFCVTIRIILFSLTTLTHL
jgi:hypothetical protein